MEYVTIGKIVKSFGIKGEVKIYSSSDFRQKRYKRGNIMYVFDEKNNVRQKVEISSFRMDKTMDIVAFKNHDTIESIEPFINCLLQIEKKQNNLPKDFFYHSDLVGCEVYDESNNFLGVVKSIEEYAPYKTLRISRKEKKDLLVPFVKAFIRNVNIESKKIIVSLIEGML